MDKTVSMSLLLEKKWQTRSQKEEQTHPNMSQDCNQKAVFGKHRRCTLDTGSLLRQQGHVGSFMTGSFLNHI